MFTPAMPAFLEIPVPPAACDALPPAAAAAERALLESLARHGEGEDLRAQALVELMALEVSCGDELAFERIRHELAAAPLSAAVTSLFRARVAWGLARFGRAAAARRWVRGAATGADGDTIRSWLLEFDRRLDPAGR
jgi:hypothetical protein